MTNVPKEEMSPATVRLGDLKDQLDGFAVIDDTSFANVFRTAVHEYVERRESSPDTLDLRRAAIERNIAALDALEHWQVAA